MDNQTLLACGDKGKFSGQHIKRKLAHTGLGVKHLAIAVLIFNRKGKVLLQKRKHKVFDNIWDLTGATHPLHLKKEDETFEEATSRCLKREWGIVGVEVKKMGTFTYFAQDGKKCENEYCALMVGEYDGRIMVNSKVAHEHKWVDKRDFLEDIMSNPQKYSAWARESLKILIKTGFFD